MIFAMAGCGADAGSEGACVAVLNFRGVSYQETGLSGPPTQMPEIPSSRLRAIGTGVFPACNDTNQGNEHGRAVQVAQIRGFDPYVVVADVDTRRVWVRHGMTPPGQLARARWLEWVTP